MDQPQLVAPSHGQVVDEAKTAAPSRDAADLAKSAEREKWRASLREANQHVWLHGPHGSGDNLDASLKRNSAFIKRLKQTNLADAKDALVKEVQLLSLTNTWTSLYPAYLRFYGRRRRSKTDMQPLRFCVLCMPDLVALSLLSRCSR